MRPTVFQVGGVLYWVIQTRNPDTMVLKDADSTPTVGVRKNGASVADSVTITKRSATTGIYDCSYNPASEVEGDAFTLEESATVTGTTTSSATYSYTWSIRCVAVERGTDNANTVAPATQTNVTDARDAVLAKLPTSERAAGASTVASIYTVVQLTDASVALLPSASVNAAAVRTNLATELSRIDVAVSTRLAPATAGRTILVSTTGLVTAVLDSAAIRAALGMAAADLDTQLDAIAAGGGGSGTGARTVTITVNDGTTTLQNATVRMTEGANTFTALTNVSGVAVFNLDDATYTVSITKSGYSYAGTTLIVNGTETATYSMTLVSVTSPTNPDLSAIEVLCLGADFTASSGIDIDFRMAVIPSSDQNNAFPGAKVTVTSNVSGIARWEAPQGAAIEYKRGRADVWTRVTLDSDSVTNVTSVIGSP